MLCPDPNLYANTAWGGRVGCAACRLDEVFAGLWRLGAVSAAPLCRISNHTYLTWLRGAVQGARPAGGAGRGVLGAAAPGCRLGRPSCNLTPPISSLARGVRAGRAACRWCWTRCSRGCGAWAPSRPPSAWASPPTSRATPSCSLVRLRCPAGTRVRQAPDWYASGALPGPGCSVAQCCLISSPVTSSGLLSLQHSL